MFARIAKRTGVQLPSHPFQFLISSSSKRAFSFRMSTHENVRVGSCNVWSQATYISLEQFTDKGIHAAKETTQRIAEWATKVQSKGVTIKQMYWTLGHYDQVCVFEAPNDETAASVLLSADILGKCGRRRCVLLRAARWRRFSPTLPDRGESDRFLRESRTLAFGSYDRGASRPAVVVC